MSEQPHAQLVSSTTATSPGAENVGAVEFTTLGRRSALACTLCCVR